jgi:hypothetical protein
MTMKKVFSLQFALATVILSLFFGCSKTSSDNPGSQTGDAETSATRDPYKDSTANVAYNLLFCDNLALSKSHTQTPYQYPYDILFSASPSEADLQKITNDSNAETRGRILATKMLLSKGHKPERNELLAVVVEVGREKGLDALAAYKDGTARFVGQTEKILTIDHPEEASNKLIADLFAKSEGVMKMMNTSSKPRHGFPIKDDGKVTFIMSDGSYAVGGPMSVVFSNLSAGSVKNSATNLLQYMLEKSKPAEGAK